MTTPQHSAPPTEAWVVRYWPNDSMPNEFGQSLAVCATRELALAFRDQLREDGFTGGRLAVDYFQVVETPEHAMTAALRWAVTFSHRDAS